jgi:Na+-driven multidrug efflux pump
MEFSYRIFVGKTAFAAVNFVMPILMLIASVGVMMGAGGSALVAKLLGEQNKVKANQVFSMIVYTMFVFGIIVSIAISFFHGKYRFAFWVANGELLTQATHYGRIAVLGGTAFHIPAYFLLFLIVAERPKLSL